MAISSDPPNIAKNLANRLGIKYQVLSDEKLSAIKAYGVADGVLGIAKPATFILDKDGLIRWKYVGANKEDRVFSEVIIEKLKSINLSALKVQFLGKLVTTWGQVKQKGK